MATLLKFDGSMRGNNTTFNKTNEFIGFLDILTFYVNHLLYVIYDLSLVRPKTGNEGYYISPPK